MWRNLFLGIGVLFIVLIGYSMFYYSVQEKPVQWVYSFDENSKEPFGLRIFSNELDSLFPNQSTFQLKNKDIDFYFYEDVVIDTMNYDSLVSHVPNYELDSMRIYHNPFNYIGVNNYFNTSRSTANALINHVFYGGKVQLYAYDFSYLLKERLGIKLEHHQNNIDSIPSLELEHLIDWKQDTFYLRKTFRDAYFSEFPDNAAITLESDSGLVKGIELYFGYGTISFYTIPHIFTNYDLLRKDRSLPETLLSDLPLEETLWGTELNENLANSQREKSLLYYIFSHPTLKWAYYILIFSVLFYLLFNLQRRQRAIPVIEPPKNLSLSFLQTISDLHFARVDYKAMLKKKMNFLQNKIKIDYHLHEQYGHEDFVEQLSKRSKLSEESINRLYRFYNELMKKEEMTKVEFKIMCKLFQLFKK